MATAIHADMESQSGAGELIVTIPSRWELPPKDYKEALSELDRLASILVKGTEALSGLYLRICDTIRYRKFTDDEIRAVLGRYFPSPRVSEFVRIANAPEEVYRRYRAGFIGFRAALQECRGYRIHDNDWLKQRKIRRAAERLVNLMGQGELEICGKKVIVSL